MLSKSLVGVSSEFDDFKQKLNEKDEKLERLERENRELGEELSVHKDRVQQLSQKVKGLKASESSSLNEVEFKSAVVANTEKERRELRQSNEYS